MVSDFPNVMRKIVSNRHNRLLIFFKIREHTTIIKDLVDKSIFMNSSKIMLVTQTRVQLDRNSEFEKWQETISNVVLKFPGYLSQKIIPPNPPIQLDWIIIQYFDSENNAKGWLQSNDRAKIDQASFAIFGRHR